MSDKPTPGGLPDVAIYTDGACEPNPGPGGYGVVLLHPKKRAESSGGFRLTTNNRMEILAAITGLEMLKQPCKVTLYSDSQYLVNAIMEGWAVAWKNKDWWLKAAGDSRTPKPVCGSSGLRCRESVLECGCPRPLWLPPNGASTSKLIRDTGG
jgi:ribonuclease HI